MFTLLVCADLYGNKVNLEVAFPGVPDLTTLVATIENTFAQEARAIQPAGYPLIQDVKVDRIQIYDDERLKWIDLQDQKQLHEYDQLYCFQPRSQWHVDLQKDLPAPRPPTNPQQPPPALPLAHAQQQQMQQPFPSGAPGLYMQPTGSAPHSTMQPQAQPIMPPSGQMAFASGPGVPHPAVSTFSPRADAGVPPGSPAQGCQISTYGAPVPQQQQQQQAPPGYVGAFPPASSPTPQPPHALSAVASPPAGAQPTGQALVTGERPNIPKDQKMQRVWAEMDTARKGWIDVGEFEQAFRVREIDFNYQTVQELFAKADHDRAGRLDWAKWVGWCQLYPNTLEVMYYRGVETHMDESIRQDRTMVQQAIDANRAREADLRRQLEECTNEFQGLQQRMMEFDSKSTANVTRRSILLQQERDLLEQEIKLERQKDQLRASQHRFQEAAQIFDHSAQTHGSPRRAQHEPVHQFR